MRLFSTIDARMARLSACAALVSIVIAACIVFDLDRLAAEVQNVA